MNEDRFDNSIRGSWSNWLDTEEGINKSIIPFALLYNLNKDKFDSNTDVAYPRSGRYICSCGAYINSHSEIESNTMIWICNFCHKKNKIKMFNEKQIKKGQILSNYASLNYFELRLHTIIHRALFFIVDIAVAEDELSACKVVIVSIVKNAPKSTYIGLITFGSSVSVHNLGLIRNSTRSSKNRKTRYSNNFASNKNLGCKSNYLGECNKYLSETRAAETFLFSISECDHILNIFLEELHSEKKLINTKNRPARCSGIALQVATNLLQSLPTRKFKTRILLFSGGAATVGPGKIVAPALKETIRSYSDLNKRKAPLFHDAIVYYNKISEKLAKLEVALDCFACSAEQVGIAEMKSAIEYSGGIIFSSDSFQREAFKLSIAAFIKDKNLSSSITGNIKLICSKNIMIIGLMGSVLQAKLHNNQITNIKPASLNYYSDRLKTSVNYYWKTFNSSTENSSCLLYDLVRENANQSNHDRSAYIQLIDRRQDNKDKINFRVTTLRFYKESSARPVRRVTNKIIDSLDPETASVILGRLIANLGTNLEKFSININYIIRWLDEGLIYLSQKFAENTSEIEHLPSTLSLFIQIIYHLRRSRLIRTLNSSPDQTAYFRIHFCHQNIVSSILMIRPQLKSYSLKKHPELVKVDVTSLKHDRILILDNFYSVVVWYGAKIAKCRKLGYHKYIKFKDLKKLLQMTNAYAKALIEKRFPNPPLIHCDQNKSKARHLLVSLNPTTNQWNKEFVTDEASIDVFLEELIRKLTI